MGVCGKGLNQFGGVNSPPFLILGIAKLVVKWYNQYIQKKGGFNMILVIVHNNKHPGEYWFMDEKITCIADVQYFLKQCLEFGFFVYDWYVINDYVL